MRFLPLLACILVISACSPAGTILGAGASAGIHIAQERTVDDAVDDAVIRLAINDLWAKHDFDMFMALDLDVVEGRVLVAGHVTDPDWQVDAIRLAWQPEGVAEVINEVRLVEEGDGITGFARDGWVSSRLRTKLTFDKDVSAINYSIISSGGIVYLMGVAQNQGELTRVLDHARNTSNVREVISYVRIKEQVAEGTNRPE